MLPKMLKPVGGDDERGGRARRIHGLSGFLRVQSHLRGPERSETE